MEEQIRAGDNAWGTGVHCMVAAHYLLDYGTREQRETWLPGMATGDTVAAIAMTEPGTGSDLKAIRTKAERDGDEYVINGAKTFISNASHADVVLVVARTGAKTRASGISLLLVETTRPGFTRGRVLDKIGQRGQDTAELFFDDVRVPASSVLGGVPGQGFGQLMSQLPQERLTVAIAAIAAIESAIEQTVGYTKERQAFGQPLFDFQNSRFTLAEAATEARVTRTFVDQCVLDHLAGNLDAATAAMAKWWATERATRVIDRCLQLYGGYGYMSEYPISHLWVDQRVQKIYGGSNEIMKEIIARTL